MTSQEKKNDRLGMVISLGVHAALLILFIFLLAWKEPFPPLPEYGIEVNFGLDDAGSGDIQPVTPANVNPEPVEEPAPEEPASSEEVIPEPTTEEAVEESPEPLVEEVEEIAEPVEETEVTQPTPDTVPVKEEPKQEEAVDKPVEKESPKLDPAAAYPNRDSKTDGANGREGAAKDPADANQGDQPGDTGDQGNPEGKLDARALYGEPGGGGGGSALRMTGWKWDREPKPQDTSNDSGRIVFGITIDDDGVIVNIRVIEKSVSDPLVKIYRSEVEKLTFTSTSDNPNPAPRSTGTITFIIKSR